MGFKASCKLGSGSHMDKRFWIVQHGLVLGLTAPLGIVGHPGSIQALVNIGRDVARLVPHDALGCFDEEIDQVLLVFRGNREDIDESNQIFLSANGCHSFSSPSFMDRSMVSLKYSWVV